MTDIVQKLWGFCHTLRHDGIGYTEYVEQLTYLLFIKMANEKGLDLSRIEVEEAGPDGRKRKRTVDCSWPALRETTGTDVIDRYIEILRALGKQPGTLGSIYAGAQSRFTKPVSLKTLINRIDETEWTALGVDVKAAAYEGLLEKAASEGSAGQLFTPRVLIQSVVRCIKPDPRGHKEFAICDPACGTGGFLVAAYEWLIDQTKGGALERSEASRIRSHTYFGQDIDPTPRRLALMNLYLHQLEPQIELGDTIYDPPARTRWVDVVLTNPPFGIRGANQAPERDDFTIATSNKQLNFVQPGGRAAVVLPDNCLFDDEAGEVFKILTEDCDLHTVLRLPRGTFTPYSQGVKANVVFFTKGAPTGATWIYDARTNVPGITKKDRPLIPQHFAEFEKCFGSDPNGRAKRNESDSPIGHGWLGGDRWRKFTIADVRKRDFKLHGFKWLKDEDPADSDDLREPEELATEAIEELRAAVEDLSAVLIALENGNENENRKGGTSVGPPNPEPADQLLTRLRAASPTKAELAVEFPVKRWRLAAPRKPHYDKLPSIPETWAWVYLSELGYMNRGRSKHRPRNAPHLYRGDYPFIQTGDIAQSGGRIVNHKQTYNEAGLAQSRLWPAGTICITIAANIAYSAILTYPACFPDSVVGLITDPELCVAEFAEFFIRTAREDLSQFAPATAQKNINIGILNEVAVPLPPLEEQREIVHRVENLFALADGIDDHVRAATVRAKRLPAAVLARAFRGELVPTEAELAAEEARDYESALVLLERNQESRKQNKPAKRGRGGNVPVSVSHVTDGPR